MGSYPDWDRRQKDYVNPEKKRKIKDIYEEGFLIANWGKKEEEKGRT